MQVFMYLTLNATNVLKLIYPKLPQIMNDISCISIIFVNTDPDCYQLVSLSGINNSTTTMKYHKTSTTDESHSR